MYGAGESGVFSRRHGGRGVLAMSRHGWIDYLQVGKPSAHEASVTRDERIGA